MIAYSRAALGHVEDLVRHYERLERSEAIVNLFAALDRAERIIAAGISRPRPYPSTYRNLARPGRAWINEAIYWIAFEIAHPPVIVAVFWERADMVRRYRDVP